MDSRHSGQEEMDGVVLHAFPGGHSLDGLFILLWPQKLGAGAQLPEVLVITLPIGKGKSKWSWGPLRRGDFQLCTASTSKKRGICTSPCRGIAK